MHLSAIILIASLPFAQQENLTEHTLKASEGAKAAKADLAQFKFLQGQWKGAGLGADCDEMWSTPAGDCMLGTFRMVKDKQLTFTEFCMLKKQKDGGVVLQLKHFDPNFHGWETKDKFVSFPLIRVEKNAAYFGGLTYAVQPDGALHVWVAMKQKDGTVAEAAFDFKPVSTATRTATQSGK